MDIFHVQRQDKLQGVLLKTKSAIAINKLRNKMKVHTIKPKYNDL